MRYEVDDEVFYTIGDVLDYCISEDWHRDDDYFEDWVNDRYGNIEINGETYYAYDIVENAGDLESLRDDYCEYENEVDKDNAECELYDAEDGDWVTIQGYEVHVVEDVPEYTDDTDGDVKYVLEQCRINIQTREQQIKIQKEEDQKNEKDIMSLFQVV